MDLYDQRRQCEFVSDIVNFIRENGEISRQDLVSCDPFADLDVNAMFADRNNELDAILCIVDGLAA